MNNRAISLSLIMAVLAVFFVQSYVSSIEDEARKKFGTEILVLKAKRDLKEQDTISETDMELELMPKRFLEPAAVSFEKKEADDETKKMMKALGGTVALVPIRKGEQITYNKITEPSIRTGLSPQIALGKRAVSVPVNDVTGVSKLVKPGDRVDIVAIVSGEGGRENKLAKTVLQDVVVLAVGRNVTNNVARLVEYDNLTGKERVKSLTENSNFSTITVEVSPEEVQSIALLMAAAEGAVTVSLRNNDDSDRPRIPSTILADVLGPDASRMPARQQAPQPQQAPQFGRP